MKIEVQIILEELRNLESAEGSGTITEEKINEICKAHGVSFEEFRSLILEMLADEAGISADELESLSFEEISEVDLDKISGGAGVSDTVKRGAASLMAILNLGSMASSYAAVPSSGHVGGGYEITAKRNQEEYDDDEMPEEQAGLNKEAVKKWAKRLGIPAAAAGVLLCICMLNNSSTPAGKVKTISAEELHKMPWVRTTRSHASAICASNGSGNEPSLKSKCYVHMSEGAHKDAQMYIVGVFRPNDGSKPSILISDDENYLGNHKNSGTVQVFDNGLSNSSNEIERSIIARIRKTYVTSVRDSSDGSSTAPGALPGGESKRLTNGREVSSSEQPEWTILSEEASRPIAAVLGSKEGPTKYFVHLSNYKPEGYFLRIVGSADNGKTVLISDAAWCADENKQIAENKADEDIIKKWEGTKVFVYESIDGLVNDDIIDRLEQFYGKLNNITVAPKTSVKPVSSTEGDSCTIQPNSLKLPECTPELQNMFDLEKSDDTQRRDDTTSKDITDFKQLKMALYVDGENIPYERAQEITSERAQKSTALKFQSDYLKKQTERDQYKFASDTSNGRAEIIKKVLGVSEIPDLRLAIVGTASTDYHHLYNAPMIRDEDTKYKLPEVTKSGPSGRPGARYARLFKDSKGQYHALDTTTPEVQRARAAMMINNTLRAMDSPWLRKGELIDGQKYLLNGTIDYDKISKIADEIEKMQAYHGCSAATFNKILSSGRLLCVDRVKDPLINKTSKQKVQAVWRSLDNTRQKRPDAEFAALMKLYDTNLSVQQFLQSCVAHIATELNSIQDWRTYDINDSLQNPESRAIANYVKDAGTTSSLKDVKKAGLNNKIDIGMGTFQTIFSIVGGNFHAFDEYTTSNNGVRCIIEIPQQCLSYTFPYAVALDDNVLAWPLYDQHLRLFPPITSGVIIDKNLQGDKDYRYIGYFNIGNNDIQHVTTGSLLFGDHPTYRKGKYDLVELSQAIKGKKVNIRNEYVRKALAFYIYCQYIVINNNKKDPGDSSVTVDDILNAYYSKLGSHACIEGHSPGEIPLGDGGVKRVLLVGYDIKELEEAARKAREKGLLVNCIQDIPGGRKDLIKAFEGCH